MDIDNPIFEETKKKVAEKAGGDKKGGDPVWDAQPSKYILYTHNYIIRLK
jgi:hypothetical protein